MVHAHRLAVGARRAIAEEGCIIVVALAEPVLVGLPARGLAVDVADHLLPEGAVVEPVVAFPHVDHRVDRHRGLERRVRVDEAHQGREAVVAGADRADTAVRFGHVPDQPVDGVPGVGRMVDRGRVERAAQGPVHHIVAARLVLAAHVLERDDIAGAHQLGRKRRKDVLGERPERSVRRRLVRRIRRAVEHDRIFARRGGGSPRDDEDGVELNPVAHRDHHFAADVLEAGARRGKAPGNVAALGDWRDGRAEVRRNVATRLHRDRDMVFGEQRRGGQHRDREDKALQRHATLHTAEEASGNLRIISREPRKGFRAGPRLMVNAGDLARKSQKELSWIIGLQVSRSL